MKFKLGDVVWVADKYHVLYTGKPLTVQEHCNTLGLWIDKNSVAYSAIEESPARAQILDYFKQNKGKFSVGDKVIAVMNTPDVEEGWVGYIYKLTGDNEYPYEASVDGKDGVHAHAFAEHELELLNTVNRSSTSVEEIQEHTESSVRALDKQVSGNHYKDFKIQPVEYIYENNIPFLEANVIKYTSRHRAKNKAADIKKAIHCLELILQMEYNE